MYIARDKNNNLYLFNSMPVRGRECWWAEKEMDGSYLNLDKSLYREVTWESDPLPVSICVAATDIENKPPTPTA